MLFDKLIEQSEEIVVLRIILEESSFSLEKGVIQYIYKAEIQSSLKGNLSPKAEISLTIDRYTFLSNNNGEAMVEETNSLPGEEYIAFLVGTSSENNNLSIYQLTDRWLGLHKDSAYMSHYIQNRK
ncbi:hypothetical protein HNP38_000094 [Chryseobacterium defluvii]|uniref:Uncharacterized protein n=1 Tax=Chryseobacterium defluvii TaxID=160396 RepID=A0A840KCV4_9FLAO|nr:hypothetical protein [Chryseobacterium defluvii]MBB4804822.1 hypothetical protein [Chryseobacterium defluvii]